MLETVRNEAAELRNFTITFLSLLLYISLIVAATDHEQILRVSPVTLPLLNVNIPILGFYWFMPPFLFCMHRFPSTPSASKPPCAKKRLKCNVTFAAAWAICRSFTRYSGGTSR
jgi:hypothetical protein